MKKLIIQTTGGLAVLLLLSGCIGVSLGGGTKTVRTNATVGQQLVDLQKAKDTGAISEAEFQAQKAKLLAEEHAGK